MLSRLACKHFVRCFPIIIAITVPLLFRDFGVAFVSKHARMQTIRWKPAAMVEQCGTAEVVRSRLGLGGGDCGHRVRAEGLFGGSMRGAV